MALIHGAHPADIILLYTSSSAQDWTLMLPSKAKRRKSPRPPSGARIYCIYIVELARACVNEPCALAPLYVGQTAHTPEHRFAQHKAGGKLAARKPYKFGVRLRYDLMEGIGPFNTRKQAEAAEKQVAAALKRRGHRVFWG